MEVKGDIYRVDYNDATGTVLFEGTLRLRGSTEYGPISELLDEAFSFRSQYAASVEKRSREMSAEEVERLRALGYIK